MSLDANYNPYSPTLAAESGQTGIKAPLKGFAKVVCIFFIILGALGLLQSMGAFVGILMTILMESTTDQAAMNGMNLFPGQLAVTILFAIINLLVSICMLAGGVFGLKQKMTGAKLIRFTAGFMVVFKVVETVYGILVGYFGFGEAKEEMLKKMQADTKAPPMDMGMIMDIGMYVGLAFVGITGLTMAIFYLFAFLNYSKPETLSQFS